MSGLVAPPIGWSLLAVSFFIGVWMLKDWLFPTVPSLSRGVKISKLVWGLWFTGKGAMVKQLVVKYPSIKKIILLDPLNETNMFVEAVEAAHNPVPDANFQIRGLTKQAYQQRKAGRDVLVKWNSNRQYSGITIFDPINESATGAEQFSKDAWVTVVYPWNVPVNNRQKAKYTKRNDPQHFAHYVGVFLREWKHARVPAEREYL